MSQTVEITTRNLRYETHRMRESAREARLLASIATLGIRQPLEGVDTPDGRFLRNGFKRLRCARQLSLGCVPYVSIADEEASGIMHLMCVERDHRLNLLEQAKFVVELLKIHGMSLAEVAETLSRSKSWVSMRQDLLKETSQDVEAILLRGDFPVSSWLYTLRPFMRMNSFPRVVSAASAAEMSPPAAAQSRLLRAGQPAEPERVGQESTLPQRPGATS